MVGAASESEPDLLVRLHAALPWWLKGLRPVLLADRAYDSDPLRDHLARHGWVLVSPHRRSRKYLSNDGRRMKR